MGEKVLTLKKPLMTPVTDEIGKFRMERMQGITKNFVKHTH